MAKNKSWNCKDMDGHKFNIPEAQIDDFNTRMGEIEDLEEYSDEWYDKIDEFNDLYSQYNMGR
jgi:hypothetical protein